MPGSTVVHAAVFTAGALLGGGIAAAVTHRKNQQIPPTRPAPVLAPVSTPAVQVGVSGKPNFVGTEGLLVSPVLKYGHPGGLFPVWGSWF